MQRSLDEVLSRVIRESGSWTAAQRRIRIEHGAAVVDLAAAIAVRERGHPWVAGERPHWLRAQSSRPAHAAREGNGRRAA